MESGLSQMIQVLARHNAHANSILLREVSQLGTDVLQTARSPSRDSAYQLLVHLLVAEDNYLSQVRGVERTLRLQGADSLEQLLPVATEHTLLMLEYVSALTDDDLEREISFQFSNGSQLRFAAWQLLTQALMHSNQHRGELSVLLSELGHPLPIDDIIVRFAEESGQPWPFKSL